MRRDFCMRAKAEMGQLDAVAARWHGDEHPDCVGLGWAGAALLGNGWRACAWGIRSGVWQADRRIWREPLWGIDSSLMTVLDRLLLRVPRTDKTAVECPRASNVPKQSPVRRLRCCYEVAMDTDWEETL
jgi:hypothetical protein